MADLRVAARGTGVHPAESNFVLRQGEHDLLGAVLYLMCDDVKEQVKSLEAKHVACAAIQEAPWGMFTTLRLPSGGAIGLYQPNHATAVGMDHA